MDPNLAVLILESELLGETGIDLKQLDRFEEAVATAAKIPAGYSGLAWKGGARLLDVAQKLGQDPDRMFTSFGWRALANGIQAALESKQLLAALSYASVPFLPPKETPSVFNHPQIVKAICAGLVTTPRPFIKPSDLGAADAAVQTQFGDLLNQLPNYSADNELVLQWSASALQVLSTQSRPYQVAAINLLRTLCRDKRIAVAYYAFRAIAEQREDFWGHPVALVVLQSFIDRYWQDPEIGTEILADLCMDDEVLRRLDRQSDMLILIGALAINQVRRYGNKQTEATAWRFVNEMYSSSALVASAFGDYLNDGSLPPLPICRTERLRTLEREFNEAVELVEKNLRPRKYKPLAQRVYQSNVQEVFIPFLNEIRSESRPAKLFERIRNVDSEELVTGSEWLQQAPDRISSKVVRKMTSDNKRTLDALEAAAQKRIELDEAKAEWSDHPDDELVLFRDFVSLAEELGKTATWSLKTLVPDLWARFEEGSVIAKTELEARHYAAR